MAHVARAVSARHDGRDFGSRNVQRVVVVGGSQWGKSELLINTGILLHPPGAVAHPDGAPVARGRARLLRRPDQVERRSHPEVKRRLKSSGGRRDAGDKMLRKAFDGGHLTLVGATPRRASPTVRFASCSSTRSTSIHGRGDKGDPIALAENRTQTFRHRKKIVLVSTPGVKGVSKIWPEWERSDQRRTSCPARTAITSRCWLAWQGARRRDYAISRDDFTYTCESCGCTIEERHKPTMLERGEWRATNPDGAVPGLPRQRALLAMGDVAGARRALSHREAIAGDAQAFVNEALAELWDPGKTARRRPVGPHPLGARRMRRKSRMGVGVLTGFVDVQRDWMELLVKGWGAGQESWGIAHHRLRGNTEHDDVWDRLDPLLLKGYQHESRRDSLYHDRRRRLRRRRQRDASLSVRRAAPAPRALPRARDEGIVDSRVGRSSPRAEQEEQVRRACASRWDGHREGHDLPAPQTEASREDGECPPGFMHFPKPMSDGGFDDEYLEQFGRERSFTKYPHGVPSACTRSCRRARGTKPSTSKSAISACCTSWAPACTISSVRVGRAREERRRARSCAAVAERCNRSAGACRGTRASRRSGDPSRRRPRRCQPPAAPSRAQPPRRPSSGYLNSWRR
jgi:hypothetical protein